MDDLVCPHEQFVACRCVRSEESISSLGEYVVTGRHGRVKINLDTKEEHSYYTFKLLALARIAAIFDSASLPRLWRGVQIRPNTRHGGSTAKRTSSSAA